MAPRPTPLWRQLFVVLVLPAALMIAIVTYLSDRAAETALDEALGKRLSTIASAAADVVGPNVMLLAPGDDDSRIGKRARAKLVALAKRVEVERIIVTRFEESSTLVDTAGKLSIGDEYGRAKFDAPELEEVAGGKQSSSVLFLDRQGDPFKTGYAPLQNSEGVVEAFVAVQAPATYADALVAVRWKIGAIALIGLVLLIGLAVFSARRVAVPLSELSASAQKIGAGHLETEIPEGGPAEAQVLSQTMRTMTASLRARDEEMQLMLAGIAHEVRNPLGGIELFGGLLKEDLDVEDPRRKHVEKILRELGVLARVVNDFLDFARKRAHETREANVHELLFEVVSLAERDALDKNVEVKLVADKALTAPVDVDAIKRAVLNVVRNAVQAAPTEGGKVWIEAEANATDFQIAVNDNGPGVPEQKRDDVFTPFFTTKQKGTGLGLALVQKTVTAHGGSIRVEGAEGGGARFVFLLPMRPAG